MFASDDAVCASCLIIAEEKVPKLRRINEVNGARSRTEREFTYIVISTGCNRESSIATSTLSCTYSRMTNPFWLKRGTLWGAMTSELKPVHYIEEFVSGGQNLCL